MDQDEIEKELKDLKYKLIDARNAIGVLCPHKDVYLSDVGIDWYECVVCGKTFRADKPEDLKVPKGTIIHHWKRLIEKTEIIKK